MGRSTVFTLVILLCCALRAGAEKTTNYYVNSNTGNDRNNGMTEETAWKSLSNLTSGAFLPGDSILFATGSFFRGGFIVSSSGSVKKPIVFSVYGTGEDPVFTNSEYSTLNGNVIQIHGSYIHIERLHFSKTANYTGKAVDESRKRGEDKKILLIGAVYQVSGANHLTVENCEFSDCPIAVYVNGQHNLITKNNFHDCNRFLWQPDWGPIAVLIGNAHNEVSYNLCRNYASIGGNFGADGGFIELDSRYYGGPIHDVEIHHNYSEANEGFMEVTNAGKNLHVYYNVSDDFQQFIFFWSGDSSRIENNTVIRSRPKNSTVNVVFTFRKSGFEIRNNIFVVSDSLKVFGTGAYDARNFDQLHEYNLYYSIDGTSKDPVGQPLTKGEMIVNPLFVDYNQRNLELQSVSPARNAGASLGYDIDFRNRPVPAEKPDIGAYQF